MGWPPFTQPSASPAKRSAASGWKRTRSVAAPPGGNRRDGSGSAVSCGSEPAATCIPPTKQSVVPVFCSDSPSVTAAPTATDPKSSAEGRIWYAHGGSDVAVPRSGTCSVPPLPSSWWTCSVSIPALALVPARGRKDTHIRVVPKPSRKTGVAPAGSEKYPPAWVESVWPETSIGL